jgi:CheY-like chemotaxis protein
MPTLLVVEDDPAQLSLRAQVLAAAGHSVRKARTPEQALRHASGCTLALVDLRLPDAATGAWLIDALQERHPGLPIIVLSGSDDDLRQIESRVAAAMKKPVRTARLLAQIARLACVLAFLPALLVAAELRFRTTASAEAVAHLELSGREGEMAHVTLDGKPSHQVLLFAGERRHTYSVFLGPLAAGEHVLHVVSPTLQAGSLRIESPAPAHVRFAPVLFERQNAIGRFTDFPILTYAESLTESGQSVLQYTVIFSNEDGGTSTRSLMARWGRATDIEYVLRAYLKADGSLDRAVIQSRGHKDLPFTGPFDGTHPLLMPVTDNNMVAGEGPSAVRYQPAPMLADLSSASREKVMDDNPITWRVMTAELVREKKLRAFGAYREELISDPRNYLYLEANLALSKGRIGFAVTLRSGETFFSHTGRTRDTIERNGWIRTAIELPPATQPSAVARIGAFCSADDKETGPASCDLLAISKIFFLDRESLPGPSFCSLPAPEAPVHLAAGRMKEWNLP